MSGSFLSPTFVIGQIKIGTIEGASCFNLGNNVPSGFTSRKVHNQGFGSVEGDGNRLSGTRSFLQETSVQEGEEGEAPALDPPEWIKKWLEEAFQLEDDGEPEEESMNEEGKPEGKS